MTTSGPVTQGSIHHLLTHTEHAVKMIESIIKDTDVDPCAKQITEELVETVSLLYVFWLLFYMPIVLLAAILTIHHLPP